MVEKMFCFQCQETAMNKGCTKVGICGKQPKTANLQDKLIYVTKLFADFWLKIEKYFREYVLTK